MTKLIVAFEILRKHLKILLEERYTRISSNKVNVKEVEYEGR